MTDIIVKEHYTVRTYIRTVWWQVLKLAYNVMRIVVRFVTDFKNKIMTAEEFNKKWNFYLEEGHYGAEGFDVPEFLDWLDKKFTTFTLFDNFSFSQIKSKFGMGRFYCTGIEQSWITEVEKEMEKYLKKN